MLVLDRLYFIMLVRLLILLILLYSFVDTIPLYGIVVQQPFELATTLPNLM